jgi:hypothetical protein
VRSWRGALPLAARAAGLAALAIAVTCCQFQALEPLGQVTDAEIVAVARDSAEGREFIRRYAASSPSVDRSGRTAVDFRSGDIRLRVFIADGPRAVDSFLDCPGRRLVSTNVVEAIRAGC